MGKVVTIYLSDDEARSLKGFCDENRCTQYSALKTAVKQLLYRPVESVYGETLERDTSEDGAQEEDTKLVEDNDEIEIVEENKIDEPVLSLVEKIRRATKKQKEIG